MTIIYFNFFYSKLFLYEICVVGNIVIIHFYLTLYKNYTFFKMNVIKYIIYYIHYVPLFVYPFIYFIDVNS